MIFTILTNARALALYSLTIAIILGCTTLPSEQQAIALRKAWSTAKNMHSIQGYEQFIKKFSDTNSIYAGIDEWPERSKLIALARENVLEIQEENAWSEAKFDRDLLQAYLEMYPNSERASEAYAQIDDLSNLSSTEIELIAEYGIIGITRNAPWMTHWAERLDRAGYNIVCDRASAPVFIEFFYRTKRLGAKYTEVYSSKSAYGESGVSAVIELRISIDGKPVLDFRNSETKYPPQRINAAANPQSIRDIGDQQEREIRSVLFKPIYQLIGGLEEARKDLIVKHMEDLDPKILNLLDKYGIYNDQSKYRKDFIQKSCSWAALFALTDGVDIGDEVINISNETKEMFARVCGGCFRGIALIDDKDIEEITYEKLRKWGIGDKCSFCVDE